MSQMSIEKPQLDEMTGEMREAQAARAAKERAELEAKAGAEKKA